MSGNFAIFKEKCVVEICEWKRWPTIIPTEIANFSNEIQTRTRPSQENKWIGENIQHNTSRQIHNI